MQNSELSVENLQFKIETAFSDVAPPASDNIIEHECQECRDVERTFRNQDWRNIEPEKIKWAYDKLPLFTPEAYIYFLPAFMLYSLRKPEGEVCEFLVYGLTDKKPTSEWWQKRYNRFMEAQKSACEYILRRFLSNPEYDYSINDIEKSLEMWWKTEA